MALINTGKERAYELTVDKTIDGQSANGYPRIYRLTDAFGNYSNVTLNELATMAVAEYQQRLSDFKRHVENIEVGVVVSISDAYRENLKSCPII